MVQTGGWKGHYFMDDWNDWYASKATVRMPAITPRPQRTPLPVPLYVAHIAAQYAYMDGLSQEDYVAKLILKDQHERQKAALMD